MSAPGAVLIENIQKFATRFRATLLLTGFITAVFGVELLLGVNEPATGLRMGSLVADRVANEGEVFRLVTHIFLHVHWIHLLLNMFALLQLGALVEALYGGRRMLLFFVLTGIFAGITSAWFEGDYALQMMGASGGIMGLAGVILGLCIYGAEPWRSRLFLTLGRSLFFSISLTFSAGLIINHYLGFLVSNWAHFGGMILGMAIAAVYRRPSPVPDATDLAMSYGAMGVVVGAFLTAVVVGPQGAVDIEARTIRVTEARLRLTDDGFARGAALVRLINVHDEAGTVDAVERIREAAYRSDANSLKWALGGLAAVDSASPHLVTLGRAWIRQDPNSAEALNSTAWFLITDDESRRDPIEALTLMNLALAMLANDPVLALGTPEPVSVLEMLNQWFAGDPAPDLREAMYLDTRAEALRQLGFLDLALEDQRRAIELADAVDSDLGGQLPEMRQRLEVLEAAAG